MQEYFLQVKYSTLLLDLKLPNVTKRNFELSKLISETSLVNSFYSLLNFSQIKSKNKVINNSLHEIKGTERIAIGFFQDFNLIEKYWDQSIDKISKFNFLEKSIRNETTNYIAIHVRLSDYLENKKTRNFHGLTKPEYYLQGVEYLFDTTSFRNVKLITDSPQKVNNIIDLLKGNKIKVEIVSNNFESDFISLSLGNSIVMSNSSFSWWAAYIADKMRNTKIIAPEPWFSDYSAQPSNLIPNNWYKIKRETY